MFSGESICFLKMDQEFFMYVFIFFLVILSPYPPPSEYYEPIMVHKHIAKVEIQSVTLIV